MAVSAQIAGLMLAQAVAPAITVEGEGAEGTGRIDVAYVELSEGRAADARAKLDGTRAVVQGDPSALINLGTAYARLGQGDKAQALYRAAISSRTRYDLQLSDGSWLDSRRAARLAGQRLGTARLLVVR